MNPLDTFCSLPWVGVDIDPQGNFKPCCKFSMPVSSNFSEYDHSKLLQQVKHEFRSGIKPEQCSRCWQDEAAGLPSKRQLDHQYVLPLDPDLGSLKILSLTFGNVCNLACVTCNSAASSRWISDEHKLAGQFDHIQIKKHHLHYRDQKFIDEILQRSKDLVHLEIHGGEPFLNNRDLHLGLLRNLENASQIKIHYITNASIYPDPEFWEIWKKFRHIDIQLSIDGTHDRFEYLRYPAQWKSVHDNVLRYQQQSHVQISISHTVSWINLIYMDDFITWCVESGLPRPYIGPVSRPDYLSVKSLPATAKQYAQHLLADAQWPETRKMLAYMWHTDQSDFFDQGLGWLKALDNIRTNDLISAFPELQPMIYPK